MLKLLLCVILLLGFSTSGVTSNEALTPNARVLQRLEALRPNEAINLGRARVLGEFNEVAKQFSLDRTGPQARDFSLKMVWAPERGRALYAGANHGRPHRLNDVWEFDLAALAWVLLYPPDNSRSTGGLGRDFSDVRFKDGVLVTERGGPAIIGHTWSGLTYDPVRRRMLFMNTWLSSKDDAIRAVGGNPAEYYSGPPLWSFSPEERTWTLLRTTPPAPFVPAAAMLEYVPELGGAIWHMNNWQMRSTWLYEAASNRWQRLVGSTDSKAFETAAPSSELVGYHDPRRRLVIARRGQATYHFDTGKREWRKAQGSMDGESATPSGHDAKNVFYYSPSSGKGILVDFESRNLWAYDPDCAGWEAIVPVGDPMPSGRRMLSFLDHQFNVVVVIDDLNVWAYRLE